MKMVSTHGKVFQAYSCKFSCRIKIKLEMLVGCVLGSVNPSIFVRI